MLEGIKPEKVFYYFEEITKIPHGSGDTDKISNYLVEFAKTHNLDSIKDEVGNVVIFKEGTSGYENSETVIIQGHMDMVCEKNDNCDIDFLRDGLRLKTDGEKIWAEGTTLGGDDGIAIAMALAILDSGDIQHPPLEVVCTVDEEIGMLGAAFMECEGLKGKKLLNLDSEDEGILLAGCAGGATVKCMLDLRTEKLIDTDSGICFSLGICNCSGGHSGIEIDKQGANASKLLGRILYEIRDIEGVYVSEISGGNKDNAIPRDARAVLYATSEEVYSHIEELVKKYNIILKKEYHKSDKDLDVRLTKDDNSPVIRVIEGKDLKILVDTLNMLPNGIRCMSRDIDDMVQTSLNLGIMNSKHISDNRVTMSFSFCVRSSVNSEKEMLINELKSIMNLAGGRIEISGDYPAWEYREGSKLLELMKDRYKVLFGETPKVETIHAGVECGIFADKINNLDCVSYGPKMTDIHTPSETLYIDSVQRTYEYTIDILKHLK